MRNSDFAPDFSNLDAICNGCGSTKGEHSGIYGYCPILDPDTGDRIRFSNLSTFELMPEVEHDYEGELMEQDRMDQEEYRQERREREMELRDWTEDDRLAAQSERYQDWLNEY